ncbi:TRAP transporter substrate-binding protein [Planktotalea sp.]|uniref:TRAP transporter substrate-binding protein n=1 Tax=Planktotalea sp. TaxID=2029877 RepID=UPI00329844EE
MTIFKPTKLGIYASALVLGLTSAASAQEFTFSIQHFLSPKAPAQAMLIEPWAKAVEEASGGRIAFEIFPAMALGGAPPELYSQVRDGVADIVWTVPGYTPGTFPRLEVFELPSVHLGDARATNLAIQDMMDVLSEDFKDVHPLLVHVHTGNALHLSSGNLTSLADFEGLKVRSPSRTGAWMLEEMGAEPVGMPVPALPQALSKGTVDAGLVPFEVAIPLGLADLTEASVELADGARFGTATFLFAMNLDSYNSLPEDLQQVIDAQSGMAIAAAMGDAWNNIEPVGKKRALDAGKSVSELSAEATAEFAAPFDATVARWVEEASGAGIDAEALLSSARAAIAANSK